MGQIAYSAAQGTVVEAFSASDAEWEGICAAPLGAFLMPHTDWPAIPKTSIRGLRFFAHNVGYPNPLPTPKSYAHTRLQIDIVKAARALGFKADLEVYGTDPYGKSWIADVMVEAQNGDRIAFEVQLSSQHLDDFIERSARYKRSDVRVCWFLPEKTVSWALAKALIYRNKSYHKETGVFLSDCEEIITFNFDLISKQDYPDTLPLMRFARGKYIRRMPLSEAVYGMVCGFPVWEIPDWKWVEQKED